MQNAALKTGTFSSYITFRFIYLKNIFDLATAVLMYVVKNFFRLTRPHIKMLT